MTDRELLELAAKAAGIVGVWHERGQCILVTNCAGMPDMWWRPHEDDGDCARLEASIPIDVQWGDRTVTSQCLSRGLASVSLGVSRYGEDRQVTRRRASVMCAAEVGRAMP